MRGDVLLTPCPLASLLPLGSLGGGLGGSLWSGLLGWSCPWLEPAAPMVWSGHHPDEKTAGVHNKREGCRGLFRVDENGFFHLRKVGGQSPL